MRANHPERDAEITARCHEDLIGIPVFPHRRFRHGYVYVPGSSQVTRAAVVAGNRSTFDACWNALNLENTDWWREWKRQW